MTGQLELRGYDCEASILLSREQTLDRLVMPAMGAGGGVVVHVPMVYHLCLDVGGYSEPGLNVAVLEGPGWTEKLKVRAGLVGEMWDP